MCIIFLILLLSFCVNITGDKLNKFEKLIEFELPKNVEVEKFYVQTYAGKAHRSYWILINCRRGEIQEIAKKLNLIKLPPSWGDLGSYPPDEITSWWWDAKLSNTESYFVYHNTNDKKWSRITIIENGKQAWCYLNGTSP